MCPRCGYDLSDYQALPYETKLLLALKHPVREYRMLAIYVLGEMRSRAAVPALKSIVDGEGEEDYYTIREVIHSLGRIDTEESRELIERCRSHKSRLIRADAEELSRHLCESEQW